MVFYDDDYSIRFSCQATKTQGLAHPATQRTGASVSKEDHHGRSSLIRKSLESQGLLPETANTIIQSWRPGTRKQYDLAWKRWYFWCLRRKVNPLITTEIKVVDYLYYLKLNNKSYSVLNTHKSMLLQTLPFFGNSWCQNCFLVKRYLKGCFHSKPPVPRYRFTWDVSVVLKYLMSLYPLNNLTLKMLTLKLVALIALATAPRAQTLVSMNVNNLYKEQQAVVFTFPKLLKTTKWVMHLCLK